NTSRKCDIGTINRTISTWKANPETTQALKTIFAQNDARISVLRIAICVGTERVEFWVKPRTVHGHIQKFLAEQACEWIFNPPHASHFGGIWERQIGTVRRILNAMYVQLGKPQFSHDLLTTLMAEVSAIVNSRPITTVPSDSKDPVVSTPNMIVTMKTSPVPPPPGEFSQKDLYSRNRWRRVQYLADQFWVRWKREFLQYRQARRKGNVIKPNINEGDIVLLREKDQSRNDWPLARVIKAYKSEDNQVRKVDVMVHRNDTTRIYQKPVVELILNEKCNRDNFE
ncbi:uncharacterized protein LOC144343438, partial [Saccoglossus kowalevskii]